MAGDLLSAQVQSFQFAQEVNMKECHGVDLSILNAEPSPLCSFVLPAFRFFNVLGICPSTFKFQRDSRKFEHLKGSWIRKAISILLGILTAFEFYGMSKLYENHAQSTTILAMQKILAVCYAFFMLSFVRAFLLNGEIFRELFDGIQHGYHLTLQIGCKFPPIWKIRLAPSCLLVYCVAISLLFAIGLAPIRVHLLSDIDLYAYFENVANVEWLLVNSVVGLDGNSTSNDIQLGGPLKVTLGVMSFLVQFWGSLCWGGAICMNTLWGLLFWQLLHQFFQVVFNDSSRNTLKDIRIFNALTGLIDKYNEAYGWVILSSISTGTVHFSMNIFRVFNENGALPSRLLAVVAFSWFGLMLIACAHVHKTACDIVQVIKSRFQADSLWIEYHGNCIETAQGMTLVLHEIQTNSIGFKGLGVFTCTYSFIGTVLSAIATYAIIVLQFQT